MCVYVDRYRKESRAKNFKFGPKFSKSTILTIVFSKLTKKNLSKAWASKTTPRNVVLFGRCLVGAGGGGKGERANV